MKTSLKFKKLEAVSGDTFVMALFSGFQKVGVNMSGRRWTPLFLGAWVAVFSAFYVESALAERVWVSKVFDGDTIRVEEAGRVTTVRLAGIDSPEKSGWNGSPGQPFADRSKAYLSNLVQRKFVRIEPLGLDPYGRTVAVVYVDSENVNLSMVRNGMAEVYRGKLPEGIERKDYFDAEEAARMEKIGIWRLGSRYESPYSWKKRNRHP
jgi:endonuclease YncB( thermonuclease family)